MINGCIPVLVTPFDDDRNVDFESLSRIVNSYIDENCEALWVLGTGSEDMAMPYAKRLGIVEHLAANFGKRIKLLVGCSFFAFEETITFLRDIGKLDIHQVHYMPYQPLIGLEQLKENYLQLAEQSPAPVWLYTSGNWARNIPPKFLADFCNDARFAGCKFSTSNIVDMEQALRYSNESFQVIPAVIKQLLPSLSLGAKAFTSVEAAIHLKRINKIYHAFNAGDLDGALKAQRNLNALLEKLSASPAQQNFLKTAEIKGILEKQGLCKRWVAPGLMDISESELESIYATYQGAS